MASSSYIVPSVSSAASPSNNEYYDVFINHSGHDVQKTFASYLYRRLLSHGLTVFLVTQELHQGDILSSQIQGVIRTASLHVALFSPRYAESKWCFDQLSLMLESRAPIIPIFYRVTPAEIRRTRGEDGSYAGALCDLGKKATNDLQTHEGERWINALSRIADMSGFELEACNGDEGELLETVVDGVFKTLKKIRLNVGKHPIGLNEKVTDFENTVLYLQQQKKSGNPLVFGIVGLGGAGKTTLAKEFFNKRRSQYSRSCFLSDVRENGDKHSLKKLQKKILESLTGSDPRIDSIHDGIENLIKQNISCFQALVILDDVDDVDQLDALLPVQTVLVSDSLILITCRNKHVLKNSGVEESAIYKESGLNTQDSRELFCSHAFSRPRPLLGFEALVDKFLDACDGLPLSLKVLGTLLRGNYDRLFWEGQLASLQHILPSDIERKLKISYDALNKEEQQIFLDIACFFIGENKDMAIRIWNGSGWNGWLRFQSLHSRCLVEVDRENNIHMHHHLRELGRKIADASRMPRRFWHKTQKIHDLLQQSTAITEVRGIRMVPGECNENNDENLYFPLKLSSNEGFSVRTLELLDIETENGLLEHILRRVCSPNLIWLRWHNCPFSSLSSWIPVKNLRVLEVHGTEMETLWQIESQVPLELRELKIEAPLSMFPKSIGKLKHLERIYLEESNVKTLPEEFCNLKSLMTLKLPRCSKMMALPDSFGNLINLQHIDLSYAHGLQKLPKSFGNLIRLKHLNLRACSSLTMSNETLGNIRTLVYLDLSHCKKIETLPSQVAHQWSLGKLYLWATNLKDLPGAVGELSDLEHLILQSPLLEMLPPSLGDLRNLKELTLWDCKELKGLPDSIGLLTELAELTVVGCPLREIPFLKVGKETQTETLVEHSWIETSEESRGFCGLAKLRILNISRCKEMEELPNIETLVSLEVLRASECVKLKSIRGLEPLTKLVILDVANCSELEELTGVENLRSLEKIDISGCLKLQWGGGRGVVDRRRP